jgi:hypothetical protein
MILLRYRLESRNAYDTVAPAARWTGSLGAFDCSLADGTLEATASTSGSVAEARASIEPFLRDWEQVAWLRDGFEGEFRYDGASVREPDSDDGWDASGAEPALVPSPDLIVVCHRAAYPEPDPSFRRSELATSISDEIARFANGQARLEDAARESLQTLRSRFGPGDADGWQDDLAVRLNVEDAVLTVLDELAARPDVDQDSRGAPKYRGPEWQWMQEALRRLALQAGRTHSGPPTVRFAMNELSPL